MSLAGANKWTLSSRIFTSMVSVGAPGMANSTISLWCSASAYATVSGATFIRTTCILTPSSLIDDIQIRRDCLFHGLTASCGRQQLANRPDVIGEVGFHCRRHAQGLMHAAEVIPRHEQRHGRFQVLQFFREAVGQPGKPPKVHPNREIRALNMRRGDPLKVRVAADGRRERGHDVRRRPEPVWPIGAWMCVLLEELREVHVRPEVLLDGRDVTFQSVRCELASMRLSDPVV